jgi:uncharacterized membrane protein
MNKQLLKDLPELLEAGIINPETAQKITAYYQFKKESAPSVLNLVLGIMGTLLAGGGLLLIVAHNWDELPKLYKTVLSFLPLVIAQLFCAYTIARKYDNPAWKECSSAFLFFAIGASIALISQIYQMGGSLSGFLLTWIFLSLPLVYLFSSSVIALLCVAGATWYATLLGYESGYNGVPYMYAVIMLLLLPHYYRLYTTRPDGNFLNLLNWSGVISITIILGAFVNNPDDLYALVFLLYCTLFCIFYFIGRTPFFENRKLMFNPFLVTGMLGILIVLLFWSYHFLWERSVSNRQMNILSGDLLVVLLPVALLLALYLAWKYILSVKKGRLPDPTGFSFIIFFLLLLLLNGRLQFAGIFMMNAWIILLGLYFIQKGSAENHLGILNFGLIILVALALCRFFDEHIPFIWRGVFFIGTGAGFFITNYAMLRKRKKTTNEQ